MTIFPYFPPKTRISAGRRAKKWSVAAYFQEQSCVTGNLDLKPPKWSLSPREKGGGFHRFLAEFWGQKHGVKCKFETPKNLKPLEGPETIF